MKIVIATGVVLPEIGGPAYYVKKLAHGLMEKGWEVEVVAYAVEPEKIDKNNDFFIQAVSKKHFLLWRYLLFFKKLLIASRNSQLIYAFDLFSCGLPAVLVKKITGKKVAVRMSGDFLWEKAVEKKWTNLPLKRYYQAPKKINERLSIWLAQRVLKAADLIIFTTDWQKEIYLENYSLKRKKIRVAANPFPEKQTALSLSNNRKIIFAGRLLRLKKIDLLIKVFSRLAKSQPDLKLEIIGHGPAENFLKKLVSRLNLENRVIFKSRVSSEQLADEISQCFLVVIPSLSEVSPNLALECIKLKKPFLLTKETGFYEQFKNKLIFINPLNSADLEQKIKFLLDEKNYQSYQQKISLIPSDYSWKELIKQYENYFQLPY